MITSQLLSTWETCEINVKWKFQIFDLPHPNMSSQTRRSLQPGGPSLGPELLGGCESWVWSVPVTMAGQQWLPVAFCQILNILRTDFFPVYWQCSLSYIKSSCMQMHTKLKASQMLVYCWWKESSIIKVFQIPRYGNHRRVRGRYHSRVCVPVCVLLSCHVWHLEGDGLVSFPVQAWKRVFVHFLMRFFRIPEEEQTRTASLTLRMKPDVMCQLP